MNRRYASTMLYASAKIPPCFGRRQGESETVVKELRQALRPAIRRRSCAFADNPGDFYIEGRPVPWAAVRTLAGLARATGGRLPQLREGRGRQIQRGAITKPKVKKTETVLSASRFLSWIC